MQSSKQPTQGHQVDGANKHTQEKQPQQGQQHGGKPAQQPVAPKPGDAHQGQGKQTRTTQHDAGR